MSSSSSSSASASNPSTKDLRNLAKKAQNKSTFSPIQELVPHQFDLQVGVLSLIVCAVASYASQISLSPVFGEIPSGLSHAQTKNTAFLAAVTVGLALKYALPKSRPLLRLSRLIVPLIAVNIPIVQGLVWENAADLGSKNGPLVTEATTIGILIFFTVLPLTCAIRPVAVSVNAVAAADVIFLSLAWAFFNLSETLISKWIGPSVGSSWVVSRCGMQATNAIAASILHKSPLLLAALPALIPTLFMDPRCMPGEKGIAKLNERLNPLNHTVLSRIESNTGYLSVIENTAEGYRILRCDHSILGGIWTKTPPGYELEKNPEYLREPIYAVFVMLEAIRLVDPPARQREDPNALVIGLGIGTSAAGLIHHGVKTHIVEIDPGVYKLAQDHFGLPMNHSAHIGDAVSYIRDEYTKAHAASGEVEKYDYILHDVFTGGAVPAELFTWEFLQGLRAFLKPNGVIAINYAGDLKLKASLSIIETIQSVFGVCRAFREYEAPKEEGKDDFTNMVIYCTPFHKARRDPDNPHHKNIDEAVIASPYFHRPEEIDFLNTWVRRNKLYPEHEVDLKKIKDMKLDVISEAYVAKLKSWQTESAVLHWDIMNTVVPVGVWTQY